MTFWIIYGRILFRLLSNKNLLQDTKMFARSALSLSNIFFPGITVSFLLFNIRVFIIISGVQRREYIKRRESFPLLQLLWRIRSSKGKLKALADHRISLIHIVILPHSYSALFMLGHVQNNQKCFTIKQSYQKIGKVKS